MVYWLANAWWLINLGGCSPRMSLHLIEMTSKCLKSSSIQHSPTVSLKLKFATGWTLKKGFQGFLFVQICKGRKQMTAVLEKYSRTIRFVRPILLCSLYLHLWSLYSGISVSFWVPLSTCMAFADSSWPPLTLVLVTQTGDLSPALCWITLETLSALAIHNMWVISHPFELDES